MELLLKFPLEDYHIKEFPDTGTLLIIRKDMEGQPDYSVEGDGFVIEFKDGLVYIVDVYEPEVARKIKDNIALTVDTYR